METLDYLHLSRPVPPHLAPKLERLALPGNYLTAMLVHRPAKTHGLPVLMLHGIQSHPGWFVGSAAAIAATGRPVFQLQRRGSGSNARDRGHAKSPAQLIADLDAAVLHIHRQTGLNRLHLLGISWGGKYAACYALDQRRAANLKSLLLVAPGLAPRVDLPGSTKFRIALAAAFSPKKLFDIPLNDPELFTDNPEMRDYISMDAHRLKSASAAFLVASRRMDRMLAAAPAGALRLPTTLILARRDRIIHNAPTKTMLQRLAGSRLSTTELEGAHTLEFEQDPQPFYHALTEALAENERRQ